MSYIIWKVSDDMNGNELLTLCNAIPSSSLHPSSVIVQHKYERSPTALSTISNL